MGELRMRGRIGILPALLWLLGLCGLPALGADHNIIPLEEIQPGMRGFGLTVFSGSRVDTFGVEVIGVQGGSRVDGQLILVEVSGHDLDLSRVAQGMSGSPIYLDDRFAGALAFGWPGSLRPMAGVTPAREMLAMPREAAERTSGPGRLPVRGSQDLRALAVASGTLATELGLAPVAAEAAPLFSEGWPAPAVLALELLDQRLAVGGGSMPPDESWFFRPVGLDAGAGSPAPETGPKSLIPGAACGIPLVTGDAVMGVTGTVSYVAGRDVLMMGHPFMQRGAVDLPLAAAEVLAVVPSREMSFKLGSIGPILGRVHHDLRAGLVGEMGEAPRLIPVEVEVALAGGGEEGTRRYEFAVVDDPLLTPTLVFWTLYNSLLARDDDASNQSIRYELASRWSGDPRLEEEPLVLRGVATGPGGALSLAPEWLAPFALLADNPFKPLRLEGVQARLELSTPRAMARITGLDAPRRPTVGGNRLEVEVEVEITPRRGTPHVQMVSLALPRPLEAGSYRLVAGTEAEFFALEAQRAAGRFETRSLAATLEVLTLPRAADRLVVALLGPGSNLMLADREFASLPASASRVLSSGNSQIQKTLVNFEARETVATPWALAGHAVRELEIRSSAEPLVEERRP